MWCSYQHLQYNSLWLFVFLKFVGFHRLLRFPTKKESFSFTRKKKTMCMCVGCMCAMCASKHACRCDLLVCVWGGCLWDVCLQCVRACLHVAVMCLCAYVVGGVIVVSPCGLRGDFNV